MRQQSHRRGGPRPGSGRPTQVPGGTGEKSKLTVYLGADLLSALRERWPHLQDLDLLRAACWVAAGQPEQIPEP